MNKVLFSAFRGPSGGPIKFGTHFGTERGGGFERVWERLEAGFGVWDLSYEGS